MRFVLNALVIAAVCQPGWAGESSAAYDTFAAELNGHLQSCNDEFFASMLDVDAFVDRVLRDRYPDSPFIGGLRDGLGRGGSQALGEMCHQFSDASGGSFRLLGVHTREGAPVVRFRMLSEQGLNYVEFLVDRKDDGRVLIQDYYVATVGSWVTDQIHLLTAPSIVANMQGAEEPEHLRGILKLNSANERLAAGDPDAAMKVLEEVPASTRDTPIAMAVWIGISQAQGEEQYRKVLSEAAKKADQFPGLNLLFIDHFFYEENWDAVGKGIDRLAAEFGPDPYLDVLRGSVQYTRGDLDKAYESSHRAMRAEPSLEDAHTLALSVSVGQNDHAETARLLVILEDQFGYFMEEIVMQEQFQAFTDSDEYKKLLGSKYAPAEQDNGDPEQDR